MGNYLHCASKMTEPKCLPRLSATWLLSQVVLITLYFPLLCRIIQYNSLQVQNSFYRSKGWDCIYLIFFGPLFPCGLGSCFLFGEPAELCHLGHEGGSVKDGIRLLHSSPAREILSDVISSINLLTLARPTRGKAWRETEQKQQHKKRKIILKINHPLRFNQKEKKAQSILFTDSFVLLCLEINNSIYMLETKRERNRMLLYPHYLWLWVTKKSLLAPQT